MVLPGQAPGCGAASVGVDRADEKFTGPASATPAEHLDLRAGPVVVDLDRQHPGPDGVADDLDAVVGRQVVRAQDKAHG